MYHCPIQYVPACNVVLQSCHSVSVQISCAFALHSLRNKDIQYPLHKRTWLDVSRTFSLQQDIDSSRSRRQMCIELAACSPKSSPLHCILCMIRIPTWWLQYKPPRAQALRANDMLNKPTIRPTACLLSIPAVWLAPAGVRIAQPAKQSAGPAKEIPCNKKTVASRVNSWEPCTTAWARHDSLLYSSSMTFLFSRFIKQLVGKIQLYFFLLACNYLSVQKLTLEGHSKVFETGMLFKLGCVLHDGNNPKEQHQQSSNHQIISVIRFAMLVNTDHSSQEHLKTAIT